MKALYYMCLCGIWHKPKNKTVTLNHNCVIGGFTTLQDAIAARILLKEARKRPICSCSFCQPKNDTKRQLQELIQKKP